MRRDPGWSVRCTNSNLVITPGSGISVILILGGLRAPTSSQLASNRRQAPITENTTAFSVSSIVPPRLVGRATLDRLFLEPLFDLRMRSAIGAVARLLTVCAIILACCAIYHRCKR